MTEPAPGGGRLGFQIAIEVGHVFKLGTRYSEAFGAKYLDEDGTEKLIVMGSYGIGPGRVLAGERHCVRPPGFDQGNSPREAARLRGDELVLATTNGAPAVIAAAQNAPVVLLACLLNLDAVVAVLQGADVQIVCAGTDGAVALEDVYVAGRISARLPGRRTDAARVPGAPAARDAMVSGVFAGDLSAATSATGRSNQSAVSSRRSAGKHRAALRGLRDYSRPFIFLIARRWRLSGEPAAVIARYTRSIRRCSISSDVGAGVRSS